MCLRTSSDSNFALLQACDEILKQKPTAICQQASLQTAHYPVPDATTRDLVGDWLFGPIQHVPKNYTLADAEKAYQRMKTDIAEVGPMCQKSERVCIRRHRRFLQPVALSLTTDPFPLCSVAAIWAKAYGLFNNGAAVFQSLPTYADDAHLLDRCVFFNNYGIRDTAMPLVWHWNAPMWWGVNTINVNGQTMTMVGSMLWGQEVVAAMRDHMEGTLREIMEHAPKDGSAKVPTYSAKKEA